MIMYCIAKIIYLKINIFTSTLGTYKFPIKRVIRLAEDEFLLDIAAMLSPENK